MKTSGIESFYNIVHKLMGPLEAKKAVSDVMYIIISDLQEQNMPVCNEEINKRFQVYANDYKEASKNNVA